MFAKITEFFKSWSFSRLNDYRACAWYAALVHLKKMQGPKTPALEKGTKVHEDAEYFIKGSIRSMPASLKNFSDLMKKCKQLYKENKATCEAQWGFNKEWKPCRWDDWTGCWLRIKVDFTAKTSANSLIMYDWKTGKFREEDTIQYTEQVELYALGALLMFPDIDKVTPQLIYLDACVAYPEQAELVTFTRKDLPRLLKSWAKKCAPMFKDRAFKPTRGPKCRWCHLKQSCPLENPAFFKDKK
jgi:hypothetical protein